MKEWNKYDEILQGKWGSFFISTDMLPVRQHQNQEELLQQQKEFAALIYFEKDRQFRRCE